MSSETRPTAGAADQAAKKIVFYAGPPSHGYAEHEYYAGCRLLADWLHAAVPAADAVVAKQAWPAQQLDEADAIVLFTDGVERHPILPHLDEVDRLMRHGVGLACIHWSVDMEKGQAR